MVCWWCRCPEFPMFSWPACVQLQVSPCFTIQAPGNLAAMAAYVTEAPPAPLRAPEAPRRSAAVAVGGVKLPPLPQKTREALEAAAMQPLVVKEWCYPWCYPPVVVDLGDDLLMTRWPNWWRWERVTCDWWWLVDHAMGNGQWLGCVGMLPNKP